MKPRREYVDDYAYFRAIVRERNQRAIAYTVLIIFVLVTGFLSLQPHKPINEVLYIETCPKDQVCISNDTVVYTNPNTNQTIPNWEVK